MMRKRERGAQFLSEVLRYPHNQRTNHYWLSWYGYKDNDHVARDKQTVED